MRKYPDRFGIMGWFYLDRSWRQCVTLFTEELPWLKDRDLELVMGEALCNWIGWPLPAGAGS